MVLGSWKSSSMRLYLVCVLVRVVLSLVPLSTLHPDEWMQSAEVMAPQLLPSLLHAHTWDWKFTCHNQSHPPHLPHALRPTHSDEEWRRSMQRPMDAAAALSAPTWLQCPDDMQLQAPIRNTLFPWLSSGLPYRLCRWAWERTLPESSDTSFAANGRWPVVANAPWLLFLLPRIAMLLLSVASDLALYRAARTWLPRGSARAVLAAYGAAFPALVFTGRTFSNAMETALLAASLWIASVAIKRARSGSLRPASSSLSTAPVAATDRTLDAMCLLFGVVVGAAAFVRLSFLFWAWPIGVALIAAHFSMRRRASMRWFDVATAVVSSAAHVSFLVALPCAAVALVLCVADSLFYRTLWLCDGDAHTDRCSSGIIEGLDALATALLSGKMPHFRGSLLLTPLTNYAYNSVAANVAHHGRHPHYLHVTVNMLLLLGPVAYARLVLASGRTIAAVCRGMGTEKDAPSASSANVQLAQPQRTQSETDHAEPELQASSLRSRKVQTSRQVVSPAAADSPSRSPHNLSSATASESGSEPDSAAPAWVDAMLVAVAWSGVLLLSLIPHQEARFLLPIIIPTALLARPSHDDGVSHKEDPAASGDQPTPSRRRCVVSTLHLLHGVCTVLLLGVLHQGGLLPTLVRSAPWRPLAPAGASPHSCPSTASVGAAALGPESWLVLSYKTYTVPTAFVHAHMRELHGRVASPCVPAPLLSVIDVGDEQSVATRLAQAARDQQEQYSASAPTAPPLRLHHVLLLWPGSVAAPVQQLRDAHAALLPALTRNLTRERELSESRTSPAPGPPQPVLQALCPTSASSARECAVLRARVGSSSDSRADDRALALAPAPVPSPLHSSFPHLSLDDAPSARQCHLDQCDFWSVAEQLALHTAVFDMQMQPEE